MRRVARSRGPLVLLGAVLGATACSREGNVLRGSNTVGAEDVCAFKDMAWSGSFTSPCNALTLNPGQMGICYESSDPLVIDAEFMAVRTDDAAGDLSICVSSDDVYVYQGTPNGKTLLSHGPTDVASDYFSSFGFGRLYPVPDGSKACFGATVGFGPGSTLEGGASFVTASYYWRKGSIRVRRQQAFGTGFGITADGEELHIPTLNNVEQNIQPVKLGLPSPILELDNSAADHWPDPSDVQQGC